MLGDPNGPGYQPRDGRWAGQRPAGEDEVLATWQRITGCTLAGARLAAFRAHAAVRTLSTLPRDHVEHAAFIAHQDNPHGYLLASEWLTVTWRLVSTV